MRGHYLSCRVGSCDSLKRASAAAGHDLNFLASDALTSPQSSRAVAAAAEEGPAYPGAAFSTQISNHEPAGAAKPRATRALSAVHLTSAAARATSTDPANYRIERSSSSSRASSASARGVGAAMERGPSAGSSRTSGRVAAEDADRDDARGPDTALSPAWRVTGLSGSPVEHDAAERSAVDEDPNPMPRPMPLAVPLPGPSQMLMMSGAPYGQPSSSYMSAPSYGSAPIGFHPSYPPPGYGLYPNPPPFNLPGQYVQPQAMLQPHHAFPPPAALAGPMPPALIHPPGPSGVSAEEAAVQDEGEPAPRRARASRARVRKRSSDSHEEPSQSPSESSDDYSDADAKPQASASKPRVRKPAKSRARQRSLGPDGEPKPPMLDKDGMPMTSRQVSMLSRQSVACYPCRLRKGKCDGARPTCKACASRGSDCVYADKPRRRGPARGSAKAAAAAKRARGEAETEDPPAGVGDEAADDARTLPPMLEHPLPLPPMPVPIPAPFQAGPSLPWSIPPPTTAPPMGRMQLSAERGAVGPSEESLSRGSPSPGSPGLDTLPRASWLPPAAPASIAQHLQDDAAAAATSAQDESTSQLTPSFFPAPP